MRFAVIGDIHSNIDALESVLEDVEKQQVDYIISTGDLVGYLPFPNEVIECIKRHGIVAIQGNHDHKIGRGTVLPEEKMAVLDEKTLQGSASAIFTNNIITEENRNYLRQMPQSITFRYQGLHIQVVHGSPRKIDEYLYETSDDVFEELTALDETIIICGHTHIPYHRMKGNKHFINAGSVGKPKHGNHKATYVVVDLDQDKVAVDIREVEYDLDRIVQAIKSNPLISDQLIDHLYKGY